MVDGKVRYVLPKPSVGTLCWHDNVAAPAGVTNDAQRVIEWEAPLAAGRQADLHLIIPLGLVDATTGRRLAELDGRALLEAAKQFWKGVISSPGESRLPILSSTITPPPSSARWRNRWLIAFAPRRPGCTRQAPTATSTIGPCPPPKRCRFLTCAASRTWPALSSRASRMHPYSTPCRIVARRRASGPTGRRWNRFRPMQMPLPTGAQALLHDG